MERLLELQDLSKYYTSGSHVVMGLSHVDLAFDRGEFVAVTGESGSGKSTLAHVLGGILPYESGEMRFDGQSTSHFDGADYERYRRDYISFVSQSYGILPGCTVLENVVSALRLAGVEKGRARQKAQGILTEVELWDLRNRRAARLSSGQKQRLSIARALAKPAPILIADEPTGNLDPENSAKVIELLAHAARERLVILITHEFREAADRVTRHIVLQDGRVAMDTQLRPPAKVETAEPEKRRQAKTLSPYIARLQVGSRPVWSTLVLLFFAMTAFAVFAFLGTFIVNLDDTPTRIYDNSAFFNGDKTRIVVSKGEGQPFTAQDYAAIVGLEHVARLEPYDFMVDLSCAYRENVDYKVTNSTVTDEMGNVEMIHTLTVKTNAPALQTVPVVPAGVEFLTAGRLPENHLEVVLVGPAEKLGTTLTVYIHDFQNWDLNTNWGMEVTVVGVTDLGAGLYFHEDLGRCFAYWAALDDYEHGRPSFILPNELLEDLQCRPSKKRYDGFFYTENGEQKVGNCYIIDLRLGKEALAIMDLTPNYLHRDIGVLLTILVDVEFLPHHEYAIYNLIELSPELFDDLAPKGSDQISVFIEDYAYTDRVIEAVRDLGYAAISPYRLGSAKQNADLAEKRNQTLSVCTLVLLAVVVLQVLVLRALFAIQTDSYRELRDTGLVCSVAKSSLGWQILLFTLLGQGLGFGAIRILADRGVERIVALVKYLPAEYYLALSAVHLAAAAVAALWIIRSLARQVYPLASRETDLEFEEVEA